MSEQVILSEIMGEIKRTEKYLNKLKRAAASFGHTETPEPKKPVHRHSINHKAAQEEIIRVISEQKKPWTVYGIFSKMNKKIVSNPQIIYRLTEKNPDIHMVGKKGRSVTYEYAPIKEAIEVKPKTKFKPKSKPKNPRGYVRQVIYDELHKNGSKTVYELLPYVNERIKKDGNIPISISNLHQHINVAMSKGIIATAGRGKGDPSNKGKDPWRYRVTETRIHLDNSQPPRRMFPNSPM